MTDSMATKKITRADYIGKRDPEPELLTCAFLRTDSGAHW
jgi:hypothetical protein